MRVVVAPDKFRGTLTAEEAARAIADGWRRAFPRAEVEQIPMADGGEGTLDALVAGLGGERFTERVSGPLGDPVLATWACVRGEGGPTGVVEMARASGTRFAFEAAALPALPGALALAGAGVETGGAAHNRRFVSPALVVADGVPADVVTLAHDPQTSGGLLAAIPVEQVAAVEAALDDAGVEHWRVGRVEEGAGIGLA